MNDGSDEAALEPARAESPPVGGDVVKRHRLSTRIWHWTNLVALIVMFMSGLMIFNAHPRLYWGQYGANFDPAWLEIGHEANQGYLRVGDISVVTTGVLGVWKDGEGETRTRAFPHWITIPSGYSLAEGRRWHLAFAWVLAFGVLFYMAFSLFNGHVKRDLHIRKREWSPKHIWGDIKSHAKLKFPTGAAARNYNFLQKASYIGVIFILLPLMILTGLTMSPGMDAAWGWLLDIFGGRQSARSIHFICAWSLVAFFFVHIAMVVLAGPINEVRSMITGRYKLPEERETDKPMSENLAEERT